MRIIVVWLTLKLLAIPVKLSPSTCRLRTTSDLVRCELRLAPELDAVLDSSGSALASARSNKLAFELRQATKYREHKTAMCRRCVGPRVVK
jgi:hypothetical protein